MRYTYEGQLVTNELGNGYVIETIAKYSKDDSCYLLKNRIKRKDIDFSDLIEEDIELHADKNELFYSIAKMIEEKHKENYFKRYIERYTHYIKCMEYGLDNISESNNGNSNMQCD